MPEPTDLTLTEPASLPGKTVAERIAELCAPSPAQLALERMLATPYPDTLCRVELRHPFARLPTKANPSDACFDLYTPIAFSVPGHSQTAVDLGLAVQLEEGWEAQVRGRSGMAFRGVHVHLGTIDHLYRGTIRALFQNVLGGEAKFEIGDRVAQMKFSRVWSVELEQVRSVDATDRGGLGSTGR